MKTNEVVNCGGLGNKNSLLIQIYSDINGRPMKIFKSEQTPALGTAISKKMMFVLNDTGSWVEYYKDGKYGTLYGPWESAINLEATTLFAEKF